MKLVPVILSVLIMVACNNSNDTKSTTTSGNASTNDTANYTTIQWIDSVKEIGTLVFGQNAEIGFRFKNTGDKPLFIVSAQPGCGCTVADYPKEAIMPGQEGEIKAGFETKNQSVGAFHKSIAVVTNTKGNVNHNLVFSGEIIQDEKGNGGKQYPDPVATEPSAH